jgi:hypothetical protein
MVTGKCPRCGEMLRLPEGAGKAACPRCKAPLVKSAAVDWEGIVNEEIAKGVPQVKAREARIGGMEGGKNRWDGLSQVRSAPDFS